MRPEKFEDSFEEEVSRVQRVVIIEPSNTESLMVCHLERLVMDLEDLVLDLHPQYIADKPDGEVNQLFLCGVQYQQWVRSICNDAGDDDPKLRDACFALAEVSRTLALVCDLGPWAGSELASVFLSLQTRHAMCERALNLVGRVVFNRLGPLAEASSEKFEILCTLLRAREAGMRALIRVGTRAGAQYLADVLCTVGFKAAVMLGQGVGAARMGDA